MSRIDDNTLSGSGSPRFGISDENSDDYSIKNRINNPQVASFWMRTMQQSNNEQKDNQIEFENLKLNARWDGQSNSEEATGLSSPSYDDDSPLDSGANESEISDRDQDQEELDEDSEATDSSSPEQSSSSDEISQSLSNSNSEDGSQNYDESDHEPSTSRSADNQSDQEVEVPSENEALRFAWWTKAPPAAPTSAQTSSDVLGLSSSKKKAALECLTERLQRAIQEGADNTCCLNLLDSIRIVAETDETPESVESAVSGSRTSSASSDQRHRYSKSRQHSRRRRSPSNRELREGLIALSQFIETKLDQVAVKNTVSSSSHESFSRSDQSASNSSSHENTSSTSSSDISERIRLEKEQKIVQLEQDCSSYKSTIEELKSLINAQNSNLQSTLAALEHMEKDRAEKADALVILRETDKKKSDFIVTLQQETTQLREELDAVHPAALKLQKINQSLHQDLSELKEKFEQLRRHEQNVTDLENRITTLQNENQQLEADVLSMIKCCTEYKKVIEEVQKRNGPMRIQTRLRSIQRHELYIPSEAFEATMATIKANFGCQTSLQLDESTPRLPTSSSIIADGPAQLPATISTPAESQQELVYLRNKVHRLEEERDEADDLLYLAKEEKKLLKAELSRLTGDVRKKESRINELEFMLDCETEYNKSTKTPSLECAMKSADESSDVSSTRESFGWIKNVFNRGFSGSSTPNFGSNVSIQSGR